MAKLAIFAIFVGGPVLSFPFWPLDGIDPGAGCDAASVCSWPAWGDDVKP